MVLNRFIAWYIYIYVCVCVCVCLDRRFTKRGRNAFWELQTLARMVDGFGLDFRPYMAEVVKILNGFPDDPILDPIRNKLNQKLRAFRGGQSVETRALNTFENAEFMPAITDDVIDLLVCIVYGNNELNAAVLQDNLNMVLSRVMRTMVESRDSDLLIKSMETVMFLIENRNVGDNGLLIQVLELLTATNDMGVRLVAAETLRILMSEYNFDVLLSLVCTLIRNGELERGCLLLRLMQNTPEYDCWQSDLSDRVKEMFTLLSNNFNMLVNSALERQHSHFLSRSAALKATIEACATLFGTGGRNCLSNYSAWCKIEEDLLRLVLTPSLPWEIWQSATLTLRTHLSVFLTYCDYGEFQSNLFIMLFFNAKLSPLILFSFVRSGRHQKPSAKELVSASIPVIKLSVREHGTRRHSL